MSTTRRDFIALATGGTIALASPLIGHAAEPAEGEISATEDLMREHGVLERVLLIYEAGLRRLETKEAIDPVVFSTTGRLVRTFVEDYHEHLEEQHLFPLFLKAGREAKLVTVLKQQHQAGRDVTDRILHLAAPDEFRKPAAQHDIVTLCRAFITMYRPHAAREDTVLFPALHTIANADTIGELGEQFEEQEEKLFGEEGFLKVVDQVADVERQLGIYDLTNFTPQLGG